MIEEIKVVRSKRRTYAIEVKNSVVIFRVPLIFDKRQIDNIYLKHKNWIIDKLSSNYHKAYKYQEYIDLKKILFFGNSYEIVFSEEVKKISFDENKLLVNYAFEKKIKNYLIKFLKNQAINYFSERIDFFIKKYNFEYYNLKLSSASKRWGSCSSKGNINLNWKIVMAEKNVIDSVILHELVHTKIMNHSPKFYELLDSIDNNRKLSDKYLNEYKFILELLK